MPTDLICAVEECERPVAYHQVFLDKNDVLVSIMVCEDHYGLQDLANKTVRQ